MIVFHSMPAIIRHTVSEIKHHDSAMPYFHKSRIVRLTKFCERGCVMSLELSDPANVGGRIKWLREEKNLNQKQLAKQIGISASSMNDLEKGRSKAPNAANLLKIAAALNANPDWIIDGSGDPWTVQPPPASGASDLLDMYQSMTPQQQAAILAAAKALKSS